MGHEFVRPRYGDGAEMKRRVPRGHQVRLAAACGGVMPKRQPLPMPEKGKRAKSNWFFVAHVSRPG
jgi:hypothetical protein